MEQKLGEAITVGEGDLHCIGDVRRVPAGMTARNENPGVVNGWLAASASMEMMSDGIGIVRIDTPVCMPGFEPCEGITHHS